MSSNGFNRRQAIARGAIVAVSAASVTAALADSGANADSNQTRTFLHQEIDFTAAPHRIYEALTDAKKFAAFTGMAAEIDPKPGGAFSMFNGMIVGRNIEMISDQRLVQAWRPTHWDDGVYSIVKFELKAKGSSTTVILDHTGFPLGEFDNLNPGWKLRYWDPLKKFLA